MQDPSFAPNDILNGIESALEKSNEQKKEENVIENREKSLLNQEKSNENMQNESHNASNKQNSSFSKENSKNQYVQNEPADLNNNIINNSNGIENNNAETKKTTDVKKNTQNSINFSKNFSVQKSEESKNNPSRDEKKKASDGHFHLVVGPEIFVSLKKGSLSQFYEIGKTLGEGFFLTNIF